MTHPHERALEAAKVALQKAEDSALKIEGFYYVNHPGGPHVIRDFRTDRNGPVLWIGEEREHYNRELERLKLDHIARAAVTAYQAAMPPPVSPELIAKLNALASRLTEQGEYEAVDLIDTVVARLTPALAAQEKK
jgi:hypothetical protein